MEDIKSKVKEATKDICEMMDKIVERTKLEMCNNLEGIDTHECYEVVDIIKDLAEAKMYIVKAMYQEQIMCAMEEAEYGEDYDENGRKFYSDRSYKKRMRERRPYMNEEYDPTDMRDMDYDDGRMYYTEGGYRVAKNLTPNQSAFHHGNNNMQYRDIREGRSGISRKTYMETKEMNPSNSTESKQKKVRELEHYMNELSSDLSEMMDDASPEEKEMGKKKLNEMLQKFQ